MLDWLKARFKKSGCSHGRLTPDEDIAIARAELAGGDLPHAAHHVACALGVDPLRRDWRELLDRLADVAPDPLALAPLGQRNYYADIAARAYLLARLNRLSEALDTLFQVVLIKPEIPYLEWAIEWLEAPGSQAMLEVEPFHRLVAGLLNELERIQSGATNAAATLERLPRLARAARAAGLEDSQFFFATASLVRRTGDVAAALALARETHSTLPGYESAVALASALRETGDVEAAVGAYREALRFDPDDPAARLDIGDLLWEHGQPDRAAEAYAEVLEKEPDHAWAAPSYFALQHQRTGEEAWASRLREYAAAHPESDRARALLQNFEPYFGGYIPSPGDAVVNLGRELSGRLGQEKGPQAGDRVEVTISCLEAPSAILAVQREFQRLGEFHLGIKTQKIQKPDPRQPVGRPDWVLWRYSDRDPQPGLPAPPAAVSSAVAELAASRFDLDAWRSRAGAVVPALRPHGLTAVLATMAHPPEPPDGLPWWEWLPRVQLAAAPLAGAWDAGWSGSERRRAVLALVRGPMDWSVNAGLVALACAALESPEAAAEAGELYRERLRQAPREGHVCYAETLALCALRRPGLEPGEQAHWQQVLRQSD